MEQLEEVQKALMQFLKICGAERDLAVGIGLSLDKYPNSTEEFLLWLDKFNPERRTLTGEEWSVVLEKMIDLLPESSSPQESEQE
jgi:hypothetical protein